MDKNHEIKGGKLEGPVFGGGNDICIKNDCNNNTESFSNFGVTY